MQRSLLLLLTLLASLLFAASCSDSSPDSNTPSVETRKGWMQECVADEGCDVGAQCICGVCTLPCGSDAECGEAGPLSTCATGNTDALRGFCGQGEAPAAGGVCLAPCSEDSACGDVGDGLSCEDAHCTPEGQDECSDDDSDGVTDCDGDCDDADPATSPQSAEVCGDGLDNNCNGEVDEECTPQQCASNEDCPEDHVCMQGQCQLNGENDVDGDGVLDGDDNCPRVPNPGQEDANFNGVGDACDDSTFCIEDAACAPGQLCVNGECVVDGCEESAPEQCGDGLDNDCDGQVDEDCAGDCSTDADCPPSQFCMQGQCSEGPSDDLDGDGILDIEDNCPNVPNPSQMDSDGDGIGDACDGLVCTEDADCGPGQMCVSGECVSAGCDEIAPEQCGDGIDNDCDGQVDEDCGLPCVSDADCAPNQACFEGLCEGTPSDDLDGDGILDIEDNCPNVPNPSQMDSDGDGIGDACDGLVCTEDADCGPGQMCASGECVSAGCDEIAPEQCGDGIDNDCDGLVDEDCGPPCASDADCAPGQACVSGTCQGA